MHLTKIIGVKQRTVQSLVTEEYEHIRAGLSEVHDSTATSTT